MWTVPSLSPRSFPYLVLTTGEAAQAPLVPSATPKPAAPASTKRRFGPSFLFSRMTNPLGGAEYRDHPIIPVKQSLKALDIDNSVLQSYLAFRPETVMITTREAHDALQEAATVERRSAESYSY